MLHVWIFFGFTLKYFYFDCISVLCSWLLFGIYLSYIYVIYIFFFQWELFRLPELDCFQAMLNRLYRQELESIVMGYEAYRLALFKEMERCLKEKEERMTVSQKHV